MTAPDLPIEELRSYRPERSEPADFVAFWRLTLDEARARSTPPSWDPVASELRTVQVFDVAFSGYGGQRIRGWLLAPAGATGPLPTVIEYIGYGGGRSFPFQWLVWPSAGYAHLVMDTRGQGSAWSSGDTPDIEDRPASGGQYPGFVTRGIDAPATHYYTRLITDAVLATDAASQHPLVDGERIVVAGASQGGGLALAVAGLAPHVCGALIDVPFMCHWRRAVVIAEGYPYMEVTDYVATHRDRAETVFSTLDHVDGLNFAPRATAPALFSVGLRDVTCPPSTVFAAFNHYGGPREIRIWPYNDHDGGGPHQQVERFAFLRRLGIAPG